MYTLTASPEQAGVVNAAHTSDRYCPGNHDAPACSSIYSYQSRHPVVNKRRRVKISGLALKAASKPGVQLTNETVFITEVNKQNETRPVGDDRIFSDEQETLTLQDTRSYLVLKVGLSLSDVFKML